MQSFPNVNPVAPQKSGSLQGFLLVVAMLLLILAVRPAMAATYYWDNDATAAGNSINGAGLGVTGSWDTAALKWWDGVAADIAWTNAGNNTAVFTGTAGTVTLATGITVGGLQFNTTGYVIAGNTLTFGAPTSISLNNIASATISSTLAGSSAITITGTILGAAAPGTLTLTGTGAAFTGSTTINNGVTLAISGTGGTALSNTSGITLNGGNLTLINQVAESALNRVNNAATITSNGGTITWRNTAGATNYAETLGTIALTTGHLNIISTNANLFGQTAILTLGSGSLTHAAANTSTIAFGGTELGLSTTNQILITGQATTAANQIIGPWATYGASASSQTDYATYNITAGAANALGIQGANIVGTGQASWTTSANTFTQSSSLETLSATRTITALRNTGATATTALGANNLETFGLLNGSTTLWTISGTGAVRQNGTAAANVYVTTGSGDITITAPITNNTGALSLVKSGEGTLTLSGANAYTGATVINAGTLKAGVVTAAFGVNSAVTLAASPGATLDLNGFNNTIGSLAGGGAAGGYVKLGAAVLTVGGNDLSTTYNGIISGTGSIIKSGTTGAGILTLTGANTYTGTTTINLGTLRAGVVTTTAGGAFGINSAVTMANAASAVLDLNGFSNTIGSLAGGGGTGGNVTLGTGTLTLGGNNQSTSYDGIISGAGALVKEGTGTFTLTRASSYSLATTINGGTINLAGAGGSLATSGITLNGGNLTMTNLVAESAVNRVNNAATITSNGGTITWTNTAGATNYAETLGVLALTSSHTNVITTNANGVGQTEILTLGGLTRAGATNTSTVAFGGTSLGAAASINQINITGQAATAANQIMGPWATYGASAASQTDYATYNITGGVGNALGIQGANIAGTGQASWTTSANTYTQNTALETLAGTRTITALRNTGATATTALGANNLETFGLLNGAATLWTISGTGAVRQNGTAAANLYVTTGAGNITISAPITNNTGALTLVKSGQHTLTLSGTNTYTGNTVVNAGTLAISSTGSISSASTINLVNGTLQLNPVSTTATGISRRMFSGAAPNGNTSMFDYTGLATGIATDANLNYPDLKALAINGGPATPISPQDNVSIQWVGQIKITTAGTYTFGTASDDGSRLFIDGVLIVNNDGGKGVTDSSNTVTLSAGYHDVRVDYYNGTGGAGEILRYGGTDLDQAYGVIANPATVLFQAQENTLAGSSTAIQMGNNLTVAGNSTVNLNGTNFTQVELGTLSMATSSTLNVTGLTGKTLRFGASTLGGAAGTITLNADPNIAFDGVVTEGAAGMTIVKQGLGRLIFGQTAVANVLSANTTLEIQNGSLVLVGRKPNTGPATFNPIGSAKIKLNGGNLILDAVVNNNSNPLTFDNAIEVTANATIQSVNNGTNTVLGGLTNGIAITTASTLTFDAIAGGNPSGQLGAKITVQGPISGVAGSVLAFKSTQLGSFSGATAGTIDLTGNMDNYQGDFRFTGTKTVTVNGDNPTVFGGVLQLRKGKNYTVTTDTGSSGIIAASIGESTAGAGTVSLTKAGNGILTLSNANSTYFGSTTINAGTLRVVSMNFGYDGFFSYASSIGQSDPSAANLVLNGGTLSYIGNPTVNSSEVATTDRSFQLGTGVNAGTISADGAGVGSDFIFGANGLLYGGNETMGYLGTGARTLTLSGANKLNNQFGIAVGDENFASGKTSLRKTGVGTWILVEANTFSGGTTVEAGILSAAVNQAFGTGAITVNNLATLELRGVNYSTAQTISLLTGSTLSAVANTGTLINLPGASTANVWAGGLTMTGDATISVSSGVTLDIQGTIASTGKINQTGTGSVTFSGQADAARNASSAATYTTQSGTLILNYASNTNGKLSDSAALILGGSRLGGTVQLVGGSHVEIVGGVTLNPGENLITRSLGSTSVLRMNTITRNIGATIQFSEGGIASTDSSNDSTGILGSWATVGLNDWAAKSGVADSGPFEAGAGQNGLINAYSGYLNSSVAANWLAGNNLTVDANSNPNFNSVANTLRFFAPDLTDLEQTVTFVGSGNKILSGGLLVAANMGTTAAVINGTGSLAGPAVNGADLIIIQNNVLAPIEISATVTNNGLNSTGVDKTGLGNLILSGNNTYTGITTLNNGVTTVRKIANATVASGLGAGSTAVDRLVFNGGTLQLNGAAGVMSTDRGFTVNEAAVWDIGNANTTLSISGQYATAAAAGNYVSTKIGSGTLELVKTTTALASGYGMTGWNVSDGTLRLSAGVDNQYARSDAALTMSGGTLEFVGTGAANSTRVQVMSGTFTLGEGASVIRVKSATDVTSILTLQDTANPDYIVNQRGGTLLISEDNSNGGNSSSIVRIAGGFGVDISKVLPRVVYQTSIDTKNPGVNYFAVVDGNQYNVVASDNIEIGGAPSHVLNFDASTWVSTEDVSDGGLSSQGYTGTITAGTSVRTIRFFNNADASSVVNIDPGITLTLAKGAILETTHSGYTNNGIFGGSITSDLKNYNADSVATSVDLIVHNWNPLRAMTISSTIKNNGSLALNLVQSGNGTTALSGTNTYTGTTYVQGGVLRLDSANALPGGIGVAGGTSHLRLDGGVLGLNSGDFSRGLGTGATQIDWTSSGGFAAYTLDRTVNLGGASATLEWGAGSFVPDNDTFILGAYLADKTVVFQNGISLGRKDRMIRTDDGAATIDGRLTGIISGSLTGLTSTGTGALIKTGQGGLELAAANTYVAGTIHAQGLLFGSNNSSFGSGRIDIGATADSRSVDAIELRFSGNTLGNAITVGNASLGNTESISTIRTTNATVAVTGAVNFQKQTFLAPASGTTATYSNLSGTKGFTLIDGGTLSLTAANTYGTASSGAGVAVDGSTVIRNGTILIGNAASLGAATGAVELGDATYVQATAQWATTRSVLGIENDYQSNANGVEAVGGVFVPDGNGSRDGLGVAQVGGTGAFLNINKTINGHTFVTNETILIKDETEHPERNGIYRVVTDAADDETGAPTTTMNLVRVSTFDQASEMLYGAQVTVLNGSNSGTYFMASPSIVNVSETTDPVQWMLDTSNPNVTLYATAAMTVSNPLDVNANGSGTTTVGTTTDVAVTFAGNVTLQNVKGSSVPESKTLTLQSASTTGLGVTFSGLIREADGASGTPDVLSVIKTGAGQITMTGLNTYHGTTIINAGNLQVGNGGIGQSGTGLTTLNGVTAVLSGTGTVQGATTITNGVIRPGDASGAGSGTLTFSNGLAFAANDTNVTTVIELQISGSLDNDASRDRINVTGGILALNSEDKIQVLANGFTPVINTSYSWNLFDWVGALSVNGFSSGTTGRTGNNLAGNEGNLDLFDISSITGSTWDTSQFLTTGVVSIVAVPEPGRLSLLALALAFAILRRRRKM